MSVVKKEIDNWDPIGLLSHAPRDEYHSEIEAVEHLLKSSKDLGELAIGIYSVFLQAFGEVSFQKSLSECRRIAHKILNHGEKHQR